MGLILKSKPVQTIYKTLGLEEQGKMQQFVGKQVADNLKKYVSFESGTQEKQTQSIRGGKYVEINVPYARFQAGGKVMIGIHSHSPWAHKGERKILTDRSLKYHGGGLRGANPFERMKADKKDSILREASKYGMRLSNG